MNSRHFNAVAGIGLALGFSIAMPSAAFGQSRQRPPDKDAKYVMVTVFKGSEKGLGVQAADAVRSKLNSDFPYKQVYVIPKEQMTATLEASGFSTTEPLAPHDARALGVILRADEYITGSVEKTPEGYKLDANLVLQRDNSLVQPLGSFTGNNLSNAAGALSKELKEARKQLDAERNCVSLARENKYNEAAAAAKEGIVAFPRSTLARVCLANVLVAQKAPNDQILSVAKEIVAVDPRSRSGLAILSDAYRTADMQDSAVVTLTRLLATDPTNPVLSKQVVEAIAGLANPRIARPVIDDAVKLNPGDPELLRLQWLILMSVKDFKEAFAQGEQLVRLDTSFADTTYFIRTSIAYANDSQPQKAAETAAKGLAKFPNQPSLVFQQIYSLKSAGQNQQALELLDKAIAANVAVENGSVLRIQLLKDLGREAETVPAIRAAVAKGDTSTLLRQMVIQIGNEQQRAAGVSKTAEDYQTALSTLQFADSVTTGEDKVKAQFLLGAVYTGYGQLKLTQASEQKSCELSKEGKAFLVEAQIMLPRGGSFAPDAMRQLMGFVMQLDPGADQLIKAYCK